MACLPVGYSNTYPAPNTTTYAISLDIHSHKLYNMDLNIYNDSLCKSFDNGTSSINTNDDHALLLANSSLSRNSHLMGILNNLKNSNISDTYENVIHSKCNKNFTHDAIENSCWPFNVTNYVNESILYKDFSSICAGLTAMSIFLSFIL